MFLSFFIVLSGNLRKDSAIDCTQENHSFLAIILQNIGKMQKYFL